MGGVFGLAIAGMVLLNPSLNIVPSVNLMRWERTYTFILAAITIAVSWLAVRRDPTRPRAR